MRFPEGLSAEFPLPRGRLPDAGLGRPWANTFGLGRQNPARELQTRACNSRQKFYVISEKVPYWDSVSPSPFLHGLCAMPQLSCAMVPFSRVSVAPTCPFDRPRKSLDAPNWLVCILPFELLSVIGKFDTHAYTRVITPVYSPITS